MNISLFFLILLGNAWIWKIYGEDLATFLILLALSFIIYLMLEQKHTAFRMYLLVGFVIFITIISYLQWQRTYFESLILISNDQQRIHDRRVQFYNPGTHFLRVIFARVDLINIFEGDIGTAIFRLQRNFFETIDPNIYFYGGFPRQRVYAFDFEKFPYILVIPFMIGLYLLVKERKWLILSFFGISILMFIYIAHKSVLGPFLLFPFFVASIYLGLTFLIKKTKNIPKNSKVFIFIFSVAVYFSALIQNFIYAT